MAPEGLFFSEGWRCPGSWGGAVRSFLACAAPGHDAGWTGEHEALHEDASRDHFIDRATRRSSEVGSRRFPYAAVFRSERLKGEGGSFPRGDPREERDRGGAGGAVLQ